MRRMTGVVQPYAWGSTTAIPELLGRPSDGTPQAELWLGAHPSAPSTLAGGPDGGEALSTIVATDPIGVVGSASVDRFGDRLPYLLKVLAADRPLSLQAHPTREQAEEGFARERRAMVARDAPDRIYADDWPKPEMFCALTEVEALCGFRDPATTYALFARLGAAEVMDLIGPLAEGRAEGLAEVFGRLLRLNESEDAVIAQVVTAAAEVDTADRELADFAATTTELDQNYPGDPGILAALLMNRIEFTAGEALYLPAGNLHAYLRGFGVEIMANSDNVLRGGLTSKFVAVDELLDILDFTPGLPPLVSSVEESPGVFRYLTPAPEFRLWRIEVDGVDRAVPGDWHGRVLLAVDGRVVLAEPGESLVLAQGEAVFAEPGEKLHANGSGTLFVAGPGLD